jgi:hypothetical protein
VHSENLVFAPAYGDFVTEVICGFDFHCLSPSIIFIKFGFFIIFRFARGFPDSLIVASGEIVFFVFPMVGAIFTSHILLLLGGLAAALG